LILFSQQFILKNLTKIAAVRATHIFLEYYSNWIQVGVKKYRNPERAASDHHLIHTQAQWIRHCHTRQCTLNTSRASLLVVVAVILMLSYTTAKEGLMHVHLCHMIKNVTLSDKAVFLKDKGSMHFF
jgi:hypothetical protein